MVVMVVTMDIQCLGKIFGGVSKCPHVNCNTYATRDKYTTTEKECLAIVNAVKHFSVYLLGRTFKIITVRIL